VRSRPADVNGGGIRVINADDSKKRRIAREEVSLMEGQAR
jgi:hypothetical protein